MTEIPPKQSKNDEENALLKVEEIKHRPKWLRGLIYVSNKLFYLGLNIFVFFVNRGIFALKALGTFNLFLLVFVFLEWWFYHYFVTELVPNFYNQKFNFHQIKSTER